MISIFSRKTFFKNSVYLLCSILALYFLLNRKPFFIEQCAGIITYPFLVIGHYCAQPFKPLLEARATQQQLQSRIAELESEKNYFLDELVRAKAEQTYFGRLHDAFEFQGRYNPEAGIVGKILEKIITPQEHAFLINQGSSQGVHNDMVAVFRTCLVGKVTETYPHYSKVTLLSDKSSKIAGYAATTKAQGIVIGANNNNAGPLSFSYVSHLAPIKKGDIIISSGQGTVFPEGFALGTIEEYSTNDICHSIKLKPLIDFTKISFCVLLDRSLIKNF